MQALEHLFDIPHSSLFQARIAMHCFDCNHVIKEGSYLVWILCFLPCESLKTAVLCKVQQRPSCRKDTVCLFVQSTPDCITFSVNYPQSQTLHMSYFWNNLVISISHLCTDIAYVQTLHMSYF